MDERHYRMSGYTPEEMQLRAIKQKAADAYWQARREGFSEAGALELALEQAHPQQQQGERATGSKP